MKATVKYFGIIAEKLNRESETLEIPIIAQKELATFFEQQYPEIKGVSFKVAVNNVIANEILGNEKEIEIALLPPFAGG